MYLKYKIQKYIYVFCILQNTLQNTKCHNGKEFFFQTACLQTLSQLMFKNLSKIVFT